MKVEAVSERKSQALESLEQAIHLLMSCSSCCFHPLIWILTSIGSLGPPSTVDAVSKDLLIASEKSHESFGSEDHIISVGTRLKRTIHPNNPATLDAQSNLIPETRTILFEGKICAGKWLWFLCGAISAVN